MPTHARTFEPLGEHRLASRLRDAAADRQATLSIAPVIHPAAMTTQVAIRFPELRLLRLGHGTAIQELHGRTRHLGHAVRTLAQPAPHPGKPLRCDCRVRAE